MSSGHIPNPRDNISGLKKNRDFLDNRLQEQ